MSDTTPQVRVGITRGRRVCLWLVFVGLVAVASSLVSAFVIYLGGRTPNLTALLTEGGDGFLIVVAITADACGRAVERRQAHTWPAIGCGLVLIGALIGFGFTKTQLQNHNEDLRQAIKAAESDITDVGLRRLVEVLGKHPYENGRLLRVSSVLIAAGLFTSFLVIVRLED